MFIATIVNFLLFSLNAGIQVSLFIVLIRKSLILDIDRPAPLAPKKQVLADNVFRSYHLDKLDIIYFWAASLPVRIKLLLLNPASIHTRWRCCSAISLLFGGLGLSSEINGASG